MTPSFWICATITCISAAVSLSYAWVALAGAEPASRTASLYAAARSTALFVAAVVGLFAGSVPYAVAIAVAMIVVQGLDAGIGVIIRDRVKTIGPVATAVAHLVALLWLVSG